MPQDPFLADVLACLHALSPLVLRLRVLMTVAFPPESGFPMIQELSACSACVTRADVTPS